MQTILQRIYGKQKAAVAASRIAAVLDVFSPQQAAAQAGPLTEADAILVTYGDTLTREGERPLCTLHRFATQHFKGVFSGIHILPFFPYSSDDGFSVTDFLTVRSDLGSWKDVRAIGADFKLMIDLVANHVSAESRWFQNYLAGEKGFEHLAIEVDPAADLSGVTRPRSLPLLTEFDMHSGRRV
ncbi:MAG: alpha-amylase family glycosyl hydrolase, partial [Desulfobacterales bacterium]